MIKAIIDFILSLFKKKPENVFEKPIEEVKDDIREIEKKEELLKEEGVEDKTLEEELEYWKNK